MFRIETDGGKYTFINDNGIVEIQRYGEKWDTGNKALLSLLQAIEDHLEKIKKYEKTLEEIIRQYDDTSVNRAKEIAIEVLGLMTEDRKRAIQSY